MQLNQRLREARTKKGMSQITVAKKLGLKKAQYISNVERGVCVISPAYFGKLAKLYDISKEILIQDAVSDFETKLRQKVK